MIHENKDRNLAGLGPTEASAGPTSVIHENKDRNLGASSDALSVRVARRGA